MTNQPSNHQSQELLPCPFCGGSALEIEDNSGVGNGLFSLACNGCEFHIGGYTTKDAVVKKWNTRHTPTPPLPKGESFYMTPEQTKKANEWCDKQGTRACGAIGGRFTYSFSPTTLGVVVKVKDSITGKELDLTDYENW